MYDEIDEYERMRRKNQARKRKAMMIKKKRERKIKRIKRMTASVAALAVLVGGAFFLSDKVGNSNSQVSSIDIKETQDVAVDMEAAVDKKTYPLMKYPVMSASYRAIEDENIKSPYIALYDIDNNSIIAGREAETKIYPASMTKVMTLIVAVENVKDMNVTGTLSAETVSDLYFQQASVAGFAANEVIGFNDCLYGLILPSGADAAIAVADMVAGSQEAFVELMNKKCNELGLKNTHFVNTSGLFDENQYTTPVEMSMIMAYAMSNETCAKVLSTYQYKTAATQEHPEGIPLTSTMFSRMYGTEVEGVTILAGKTGYTDEAGSCLVSYAEKNGHHYVALTAAASYKWHVIFDDFEIYRNYLP